MNLEELNPEEVTRALRVANSTLVLPAIRTILNTYSLETPSIPDLNTHPPGQQHGTCIIPLWRQTPSLHEGCPSWPAFQDFSTILVPILMTAATILRRKAGEMKNDYYRKALRLYLSQVAKPPPNSMPLMPPEAMQDWNVFECMRLSANLALDERFLDPGDGNRAAIMMGFGDAKVEMLIPQPEELGLGQYLFVDVGTKVGMRPYEGTFYLMEFFLPKLSGDG